MLSFENWMNIYKIQREKQISVNRIMWIKTIWAQLLF